MSVIPICSNSPIANNDVNGISKEVGNKTSSNKHPLVILTENPNSKWKCPYAACNYMCSTLNRSMNHMWRFKSRNGSRKTCSGKQHPHTVQLFTDMFSQSVTEIKIFNKEFPDYNWTAIHKLISNGTKKEAMNILSLMADHQIYIHVQILVQENISEDSIPPHLKKYIIYDLEQFKEKYKSDDDMQRMNTSVMSSTTINSNSLAMNNTTSMNFAHEPPLKRLKINNDGKCLSFIISDLEPPPMPPLSNYENHNGNEKSSSFMMNMIQNKNKCEKEVKICQLLLPDLENISSYKYSQRKLQLLMSTFPTAEIAIAKESKKALNAICQINHSFSTAESFHDFCALNCYFIESKKICQSLKLQIEKSHENNCQEVLKNIEQCEIHYNGKIEAQSHVKEYEKLLEENLQKINDLKNDLLSTQKLRVVLQEKCNEKIDNYRKKENVWCGWKRSVEQYKEVNHDMQLIVDHEMHVKLDDILNEIENKLHVKCEQLLFAWQKWTTAGVSSWMKMGMKEMNAKNDLLFQPSTIESVCSMIDKKGITGKDLHFVNKLLLVDLLSVEEIDCLLLKIKNDLLDNKDMNSNKSEKDASAVPNETKSEINKNSTGDKNLHCKLCEEREVDTICFPCAHVCLCWRCYLRDKEEINMKCPVCNLQCTNIRQFMVLEDFNHNENTKKNEMN